MDLCRLRLRVTSARPHALPPSARYETIPDEWSCPEFGVTQADFFCFND